MYRSFDFDSPSATTGSESTSPAVLERSPLTAGIDRARNNSAYHRRLVERLGRGSEWSYEGECNDLRSPTGKCSCGHEAIRYEFMIRHPDGRTAILGSSCIESYPGISPEVLGAVERDLERLEEEAAEREKKAKEIARDKEIATLYAQWSARLWELDRLIAGSINPMIYGHGGRRVHRELWRTSKTADSCKYRLENHDQAQPHRHAKLKQFKLKTAAIKWLKGQIALAESWIKDPWE